ncbi:hypothetical protein Acy02nite_33520 [Actinoplanes cyaneus]|uniref:Uncharacterized protein n=1 Tax=Actinoplanes cyaneus TaxID=52696 RepID=A0A919IJ71_9ACTN|nr:hypothetical protein Acy02nite_33520 [Actinoplanes cyaneus]
MRTDWAALPKAVTEEIADRVGGTHATPATAGDHAEIAATVTGTRGKVFVKAAHTDFGVRSLRFELRVSEAVRGSYSPVAASRVGIGRRGSSGLLRDEERAEVGVQGRGSHRSLDPRSGGVDIAVGGLPQPNQRMTTRGR